MRRKRWLVPCSGLGAIVLSAAMACGMAPGFATAQPVQWTLHPAPSGGRLAADGAGHLYIGGLAKLDFAGAVLWSVPPPRWPCEFTVRCSTSVAGWAADATGVYLAVNGAIGPMACAAFCGGGNLFAQPADGGAAVSLYVTPFTQPPSAMLAGVATGAQGELATFGHDAGGGYFVRLRPTVLEIRHGTRMTAGAIDASGAIVVSGTAGGSGFVRRYGGNGDLQWTAATSATTGCAKLIIDADGRVACLSRSGTPVGEAGEWRGVVDLFATAGTPIRTALAVDVNDLTFDGGGNLWTAGVACGGVCAVLRKHDASGVQSAATTDADASRWSAWLAVAAGPTGDVYVTGLARPAPAPDFMPSDMVTARYDAAAVMQWQAVVDGAARWNDYGLSVLATPDGAVVSGALTDSGIATTPIVIRYGAAPLVVPTMALAAAPDPARVGGVVTLTATLAGATAPTGSVAFSDGTAIACAEVPLSAASAMRAAATCAVAATTEGTHRYRATYGGDGIYAPTVATLVVTVLPGAVAEIPALSPWGMGLLALLLASAAARRLARRVHGPDGRSDRRRA